MYSTGNMKERKVRTVLEVSESGNMRQAKTENTNVEKSLNNIEKL